MKNKVLVTGGTGFLGKAVCSELISSGYSKVISVGSKDFDLTNKESIALMAAHSTTPNMPNERENMKYGWIGNYLSNMYFKYLAMVPIWVESIKK